MRYYGCKEKLLNFIEDILKKADLYPGAKFVDLFTGTTSVAKHFKKLGYTVLANDNLEFCYALAKTYIETNEQPKFFRLRSKLGIKKDLDVAQEVIGYINNLPGEEGFIFNNYAPEKTQGIRRYFTNKNAQKIDAIRHKIEDWKNEQIITEIEFYYLLTALLEAVNLVSNVAGTYAACLKTWDPRALKTIALTKPQIIHSKRKNKAFKEDANKLIRKISADIVYLDPPYNERQYSTNYFILELIAEGWFNCTKEALGKTGLVVAEEKKSLYSKKRYALETFRDLINNARTNFFLMSYSNEGIITPKQIESVLSTRCEVEIISGRSHKRYRSVNQTVKDPDKVEELLFFVKTDDAKKRFNNLAGSEWLRNSLSIWKDIRKNSEEIALKHPAMFPISLAEKLIEIFTNQKNQLMLDPFVGSGSTAIASVKKNMKIVGLDLNPDYIEMTNNRLRTLGKENFSKKSVKIITDNAINLEKYVQKNSVDITITSPPYWDILNRKRTADGKKIRNYGKSEDDLGNIQYYDNFIAELAQIFSKVYSVTKPGKFCIVIVMDLRKKSNFYPFHSDLSTQLNRIGFKTRDIIIWDRQAEYNNVRPLGYPYSFIVNKVHEYILIFQKPQDG